MSFAVVSCAGPEKREQPPRRKYKVASIPPKRAPARKPPSARPYKVMGKWYYPRKSAHGYSEVGYASWYGPKFHGKSTSSGERFNMYRMTAAHKTLPLGTYVKVSHLGNGSSAVVRINDRGPFVDNRIIDLSLAAARNLDMVGEGVARVKVEVLGFKKRVRDEAGKVKQVFVPKDSYVAGDFAVQVASFVNPENARRFRESILDRFPGATIVKFSRGGVTYHRVQAKTCHDLNRAREEAERLAASGFPGAFAVAVDPEEPKR